MTTQSHVVIPFLDLADMTIQAARDVQVQTGVGSPVILLVDNGSLESEQARILYWAADQQVQEKLTLWVPVYDGPLGGVWNHALNLCWMLGAEDALVLNNDARIAPWTYEGLRQIMRLRNALFVSAVNVTEEQWQEYQDLGPDDALTALIQALIQGDCGGPDYSCFLISKECHQHYPFDENLTYRGDLDHHRRIMLAGEGKEGKRIFSIPLPYRHLSSRTIHRSATAYAAHCRKDREQGIYYVAKWGGDPNKETFREPFSGIGCPGVTTPELQRKVQAE